MMGLTDAGRFPKGGTCSNRAIVAAGNPISAPWARVGGGDMGKIFWPKNECCLDCESDLRGAQRAWIVPAYALTRRTGMAVYGTRGGRAPIRTGRLIFT